MPTAAKLASAVLFAALSYLTASILRSTLPGGAGMSLFAFVCAAIGMIMGWRVMGPRAGDGLVAAISYGLTTVFTIVFWGILIFAGYEMLNRAVRGRYDGPFDALSGMGGIMIDYGTDFVTPGVVGVAAIGGVICGAIVEAISARWP